MIADLSFVAMYLLCMFLVRSRLAVYASLAFVASIMVYGMVEQPYMPHVISALIYCGLALACKPPVSKAAFLIVLFQYIMAWDAFLFSQFETILYMSYPYISSALNLALLYSLMKVGGEKIGTNNNASAYRLSHL